MPLGALVSFRWQKQGVEGVAGNWLCFWEVGERVALGFGGILSLWNKHGDQPEDPVCLLLVDAQPRHLGCCTRSAPFVPSCETSFLVT